MLGVPSEFQSPWLWHAPGFDIMVYLPIGHLEVLGIVYFFRVPISLVPACTGILSSDVLVCRQGVEVMEASYLLRYSAAYCTIVQPVL